jgi:hypothetical protein
VFKVVLTMLDYRWWLILFSLWCNGDIWKKLGTSLFGLLTFHLQTFHLESYHRQNHNVWIKMFCLVSRIGKMYLSIVQCHYSYALLQLLDTFCNPFIFPWCKRYPKTLWYVDLVWAIRSFCLLSFNPTIIFSMIISIFQKIVCWVLVPISWKV